MALTAATGLSTAQQRELDNTYPGFKDQGISAACATKTDVDNVTADLLSTASGKGASQVGVEDASGFFDSSNVEDVLAEMNGTAKALYDFATHGGAIGNIAIGPTLPDNATITRTRYEVLTTLTSATDAAEVGLGIPTDDAAGLAAGVAISNGANPWDAGWHEGIQDGAVANYSEKLTAARQIQIEIGTEALTAGRLLVICDYVVTE